ncbi:hypothetical protein [Jiangella muralis]|uniref:hypothetical protein n=1 Tax=Jiangella muralis TaxID=702383 RepID=UPI0012F83CC4|nr:hypothetical protein [Jiangella muralis]
MAQNVAGSVAVTDRVPDQPDGDRLDRSVTAIERIYQRQAQPGPEHDESILGIFQFAIGRQRRARGTNLVIRGHQQGETGSDGVLPCLAWLGGVDDHASVAATAGSGMSDDGDLPTVEHAFPDTAVLAEPAAGLVPSIRAGESMGACAEQHRPQPRTHTGI